MWCDVAMIWNETATSGTWINWGLMSASNNGYERRHRVALSRIFSVWGLLNVCWNFSARCPRLNGPRGGWHMWSRFSSLTLLAFLVGDRTRNSEQHYQLSYWDWCLWVVWITSAMHTTEARAVQSYCLHVPTVVIFAFWHAGSAATASLQAKTLWSLQTQTMLLEPRQHHARHYCQWQH